MDIVLLQTSDAFNYAAMLRATSSTVIEYCRSQQFRYESFTGLKRGIWPWQATYNRIFLFQDLIERGFSGWAIYLDADAYIVDLSFDLRGYLADKADKAAVLTPSMATSHPWDVNSGVCLFNLGHPEAREVLAEWHRRFAAISDAQLRDAREWDDIDHDQTLLQAILRDRPSMLDHIHLQSSDLMNSSFATFIRQHLRGYSPDLPSRVALIEAAVRRVLGAVADPQATLPSADIAAEVVMGLYEGLLDRLPDQEGGDRAAAGIAMLGLRAGVSSLSRGMTDSAEFRSRFAEPACDSRLR